VEVDVNVQDVFGLGELALACSGNVVLGTREVVSPLLLPVPLVFVLVAFLLVIGAVAVVFFLVLNIRGALDCAVILIFRSLIPTEPALVCVLSIHLENKGEDTGLALFLPGNRPCAVGADLTVADGLRVLGRGPHVVAGHDELTHGLSLEITRRKQHVDEKERNTDT